MIGGRLTTAVATLLLCAACSGRPAGDDLVKVSYEGADALLKGVDLGPDAVVVYGVFTPVGHVDSSSPFGRIVAEQIASRLVQRGVKVVEVRLREQIALGRGGPFTLSDDARKVASRVQARAALTGSYATTPQYVLLNARLVDVATGVVLASWDKRVELDGAELTLLTDQPAWYTMTTW